MAVIGFKRWLYLTLIGLMIVIAAQAVGRIAPRGRELAVASARQEEPGIYLIDMQRGLRVQLIHENAFALNWSPDGEKLVYLSGMPASDSTNYTVHDVTTGATQTFSVAGRYFEPPDWSPDGERLILVLKRDGGFHIYTLDTLGKNLIQLTTGTETALMPTWSEDGQQIAFVATKDRNYQLFIMDADGCDIRQMTHNMGDVASPAWSPDGRQIAFTSNRFNQSNIIIFDIEHNSFRALTASNQIFFRPQWSPDGTFISFERMNSDLTNDIYMMAINGGEPILLFMGKAGFRNPVWRP